MWEEVSLPNVRLVGTAKSLQVVAVDVDLKSWYSKQGKDGVELYKLQGRLTADRLKTSSGWPMVKGKAAGTRHLSGYVVELVQRYNSGSEHDLRRLACAELMHCFYNILKQEGFCLSREMRPDLEQRGKL